MQNKNHDTFFKKIAVERVKLGVYQINLTTDAGFEVSGLAICQKVDNLNVVNFESGNINYAINSGEFFARSLVQLVNSMMAYCEAKDVP
jgi:hypothetical protein